MRHTLLPIEERKKLRHEYHLHLAITLLFMLSVAGIIGVVSMLPTYVRSRFDLRAEQKLLSSVKSSSNKNSEISALEKDIANSGPLLPVVSQSLSNVKASDLIKNIISLRNNVVINSISIDNSATTSIAVTIQGVAPTRESLISYKSRLDGISGVMVDLPVSQLAQSTNVKFYMKVNRKLP